MNPIKKIKEFLLLQVEKFFEKNHPINLKHLKIIILFFTFFMVAVVIFLGWITQKRILDTVKDDFNEQQLILARHTATQIENIVNMLKREITLLRLSPSIQYKENPGFLYRLNNTFMSVKHFGVNEVIFIDYAKKKLNIISEETGFTVKDLDTCREKLLDYAKKNQYKEWILLNNFHRDETNHKISMDMVTPVWQVSIDEAHPRPTGKFSGIIVFKIDIPTLIHKVAEKIHSGKTGYSWVIDNQGNFLYHPVSSFIGENAFEVRKQKAPDISFERIEKIQKEMILGVDEGKGWYVSGWHRELKGKIEKLIAWSSVKLDSFEDQINWHIAVVAPVSEIEGSISSIQLQHILLQAVLVVFIILGGWFFIVTLVKWSRLIEKSEEKYKSLVESADDIIFTIDKNYRLSSINKRGIQILGNESENLINKAICDIFPPEGEFLTQNVQHVFREKEPMELTHKVVVNDKEYWFNTKLRELKDEKGDIYAVLGISRDITERKKMEQQSYHLEILASLGTLGACVAHEINNPMAVILGFTDILLEKTPKDSETYEILKIIEKQAINAKNSVENLLSFVRRREHKEELVNINECLDRVLKIVQNTALLKMVEIQRDFQENLPLVKGDAGELQQVFFNIINNALYEMKNGGILKVTTRYDKHWVEVFISDTGPGIPKQYRNRIFEPFFTTKEEGKGTGLGLWISYNIIDKHDGIITFKTKTKEELKDTSEQTGTTFLIKLPAHEQ